MNHLQELKNKLKSITGSIVLETQRGSFVCSPFFCGSHFIGVNVSNLGDKESFISVDVFVAVISLLRMSSESRAEKGDAMNCKLGENGLRLNTVEGFVASLIYGKSIGDSVFRRITPVSKILEWSGVCENGRGYLKLKQ